MYRFAVFGLQNGQLQGYRAPLWLLLDFISARIWIFVLVLPCPKVCVPCLLTGYTLQASLPGEGVRLPSTWKLSATLGDLLAQTPAFYTLLQADLYQSQLQSSQLPHLWNAFIMWTYRQFLLQFPPGILILGKITLLIRDNCKGVSGCMCVGNRAQRPDCLSLLSPSCCRAFRLG